MFQGLVAAAATLLASAAIAADYPTKPIRLIVAFPPGGGVDVAARVVGQKLALRLGKPIVIENIAGAGGNIGAERVVKSPPDGYTVFFASGALTINPSLYKNLGFDPMRDLAPVSLVLLTPYVLMVNNALPIRSVKDLVGAAKSAQAAPLQYASAGNGSAAHLFTELMTSSLNISLTHVPYKGATPAMNDVLGGHVPIVFDSIITALPLVQAGKVSALAVSTKTRSSVAPNIPTLDESGVPGYEAANWMGLLVPAGTPKDIIRRLNSETTEVLKDSHVKEQMKELGAELVGSTPEAMEAFLRGELAKWAKVTRDAKIQLN